MVENVPNAPIWVAVSQTTGEIIGETDDPDQWLVDPPYIEDQPVTPGALVHVVDIWDQTTREQILCASALEKFWEDETNEYYFSCIKSQYIMVMDSTGRIVDVVTALEDGLITIETLDYYGIGYSKQPKT